MSNVKVPQNLSNEDLRRIMDIQQQELSYRVKELELRRQQDANNFEYAKQALAVQSKNNEQIRINAQQMLVKIMIGIGLLFILPVCVVIILAFVYDKTEIASEIIKAAVYIVLGAFGGFGVSKAKGGK